MPIPGLCRAGSRLYTVGDAGRRFGTGETTPNEETLMNEETCGLVPELVKWLVQFLGN